MTSEFTAFYARGISSPAASVSKTRDAVHPQSTAVSR